MNPVLSARGVGFGYGDRDILRGVTVDLSPGEVTILLGPNGAGKSTLLRILSGILAPREGEVLLCGRPPGEFRRREMARLLSVVGQDPPVDFPMTVAAYVGLGRFPHQGFFGGTSPEDREQVERAMERTELTGLRDRALAEISAGERQRAAVARAIAQEARVMLLDEPTAFLDIRHRVAFYEIVTQLKESCGIAAMVASHDLSLCAEYGERIVLLSGGTVAAQGRPEEVLTPANVQAAYGVAVACDRNPATGAIRVTPLRGMPTKSGARSTQGGPGEDGANPSLPRICHRNETRTKPLFRFAEWEGAGSRPPEARRSGPPCIRPHPFEGKEEQCRERRGINARGFPAGRRVRPCCWRRSFFGGPLPPSRRGRWRRTRWS